MLTGSNGIDIFSGLAGRDTLFGLVGDDFLDGGSDQDSMLGGGGNDTYVVDNARDAVVENAGEGVDAVQSSVSFTLPANVENLTLTGTLGNGATGNADANVITGNAGNNLLAGLGGADTIDGGDGIDTATYAASAAGVAVSLVAGVAGLGGDGAGDLLFNIENLTGSAFGDSLEGDAGNNVLDGGNGVDTASYAHAAAGVSVSLAINGAQVTGGAGSDTLVNMENLTGSAFDDVLIGNGAANVLAGGGGADRLNGGAGADTLLGGAGADRFVFTLFSDIPTGTLHDQVADFSHADGDLIDLSALDADSKTSGDQAFSFIGAAAFGNHAGELRYVVSGGVTTLQGDVNGDGKADFTIDLLGVPSLVAADFVL